MKAGTDTKYRYTTPYKKHSLKAFSYQKQNFNLKKPNYQNVSFLCVHLQVSLLKYFLFCEMVWGKENTWSGVLLDTHLHGVGFYF